MSCQPRVEPSERTSLGVFPPCNMIAHSAAPLSSSLPSPAAFPDSRRSVYAFLFIFYSCPPPRPHHLNQYAKRVMICESLRLDSFIALLPVRSTPTASLSPSARPFFFFKPLPRMIICISLDRGNDACQCLRPCQSLFFPWYSFLCVHLHSSHLPLPAQFPFQQTECAGAAAFPRPLPSLAHP